MKNKPIWIFIGLFILLSCIGCAERREHEVSSETEETSVSERETMPSEETSKGESSEADSAEKRTVYDLTADTLPRFDGSTAIVPLGEAVISEILGIPREEASEMVAFSRTTQSYLNFLQGKADILLIGECNDEVLAEKERLGVEWIKKPFGMDAFVFVVNEKNPVDSITIEEARDIYSGKITNWKELGGEDLPITAFQRNEAAGSQTLMKKWIMQDTPFMEAETEYVIDSMNGLMEAVKSYDNSSSAIGYSVYYYAEDMKMAQGLKLLKLNGVEPNDETIRNGEYPILNANYVVIHANEPEDSPARLIFDWLFTEAGQKVISEEGYVSVMKVSETDRETVTTERFYEDYMDHLIPREDYGTLIPYVGRVDEAQIFSNGYIYGLMTKEGRIVTDPVYVNCQSGGAYLLLTEADADTGRKRITLCSSDGSRISSEVYTESYVRADKKAVLLSESRDIVLLDADGTVFLRIPSSMHGLSEADWLLLEDWIHYQEGIYWRGTCVLLSVNENTYTVYDYEKKERRVLSGEEFSMLPDPALDEVMEKLQEKYEDSSFYDSEKQIQRNRIFDSVNGEDYFILEELNRYPALYYSCYNAAGELLAKRTVYTPAAFDFSLFSGILGVVTDTEACYYRLEDNALIFRSVFLTEPLEYEENSGNP